MRKLLGCMSASAGLAAAVAVGGAAAQEAPKSIKVGYVISLSGPQAAGAMLTTVPNYRLWVDEVNKAGGLMLKKYNKRIPHRGRPRSTTAPTTRTWCAWSSA